MQSGQCPPSTEPAGARRSQRPRNNVMLAADEDLLWSMLESDIEDEAEELRLKKKMGADGRDGGHGGNASFPPASMPASSTDNEAAGRPGKRARQAADPAYHAGPSHSRAGTEADDEEEDDFNAATAHAVFLGITSDELSEEEKLMLPPGFSERTYARVRNAVLAQWRADVSATLPLPQALAAARPKERAYVLAAWRFLDSSGYINYGVSSDIQHQVVSGGEERGSVLVIGSGCAGLAAARQLRRRGYKVLIVEGRGRPGGRVYTERLAGPDGSEEGAVVADVAGSIITGIDGNPLAVVAKQLALPLMHIREEAPLYMPDGSRCPTALDKEIEHHYDKVLMRKVCQDRKQGPKEAVEFTSLGTALETQWQEQYPELKAKLKKIAAAEEENGAGEGEGSEKTGQPRDYEAAARQLYDWHLANLEFANSCTLEKSSLLYWDQDDPYEVFGAHCFVPGCNGRWLKALCEGIPILYDSPVAEIRYCKSGVAVHTPTRVLHADAVVVTIPLGVLKRGGVAFNPPLPERKRGAISRLGMGTMNKVIMQFPRVFWDDDSDIFGHVSADPARRGEGFLFYSYAGISGGAQLTALISGAAAEEQERRPPGEVVAGILGILRGIFEPRGIEVPAPLQVIVTRWGSDPMAYGAYSSLPVGSKGGEDYDIFAETVGGRLFFAGEATNRRAPATMHGAFFTGLWAAADVDAALSLAKGVPQAGAGEVAAAVAAERAAVAAAGAREVEKAAARARHQAANGNGNHAGPSAATTAHASVPAHRFTKLRAPVDPAAAVASTQLLSSRLKLVFQDPQHPPDLEFGAFQVVFSPPASAQREQALLRLDVNDARGKKAGAGPNTRPIVLYRCVSRQVALALLDMPNDETRVAVLTAVNNGLLGREAIGEGAETVVEAILQARR